MSADGTNASTRRATVCPWADRLAGGSIASLSEDDLAELGRHAEGCAACAAALAAAEAPLGDALRGAARAVADEDEGGDGEVDISPPLSRLNELLPDYELLGELGRGGMGVVYRARQRSLDRLVAVKILPAILGAVRPDAAARFRREATLAARLKHSNIIGVYDYGEAEGTLYYAMELVEGRTLADLLREFRDAGGLEHAFRTGLSTVQRADRSPTPPTLQAGNDRTPAQSYYRGAARWIADVAEGVQYAHEHGVLHRDLKPSNLIVGADGRLLIADFGLARPVSGASLTASRSLLGTSRYMSPERVDPTLGPVDARADVYALGATLYELLTLRPAFEGADDREVLHRVAHATPAPPSELAPRVPRELETVCLKALARRPEDRYGSAGELAEDLRRWLLGLPVLARRPGLPVRIARYVRRRKAAAVLAGCLLIAAIAAAVFGMGALDAQQRERAAQRAELDARVERLKLESVEAYRAGRTDAALAMLDELLTLRPGSPDARRARAQTLRVEGQTDAARRILEELVAEDPRDWGSRYALGMLLYSVGDSTSAQSEFAVVQELRPGTAEALWASAKFETDDETALALLDRAAALDPASFEVARDRAKRLGALGRADERVTETARLIAIRPGWALARADHGYALLRVGRFAEAEDAFTKAIEFDPSDPVCWHNRSVARAGLGDTDGALADSRHALELDPEFHRAWIAMARAKQRSGDLRGALADYDEGIRRDPHNKEAYIDRMMLHHQRGDFEAMAADATRMIQLDPFDPRAYQNRLAAYMLLGDLDRAVADARRSVELEPNNPSHHNNLGKLLMVSGRPAEAAAAFTRAVEARPEDWRLIAARGLAHFRAGEPDRAVIDAGRALELNTDLGGEALLSSLAYWELGAHGLATSRLRALTSEGGLLGSHASLFLYLVLIDRGENGPALEALHAADSASSPIWTRRITASLAGRAPADDVLARAATDEERAEALFFFGAQLMLSGETGEGEAVLRECIALGLHENLMTAAADMLLRRLDAAGDTETGIPPARISASQKQDAAE